MTQAIDGNYYRGPVLEYLAGYLTGEQKVTAKQAARIGLDQSLWASSLKRLIEHLPASLLPEVVPETWQIRDLEHQLGLLETVIPRLPPTQQQETVLKAVEMAREHGSTHKMARVFARLAPYLPEELFREALVVAPKTDEDLYVFHVWANLLPHLPPTLAPTALATYRALPRQMQSLALVGQITVKLPEAQQDAAIEGLFSEVGSITDVNSRAQTFIKLVKIVPDRWQPEAVFEGFRAARRITGSQERATVLSMLAPYLPADLHDQALTAARQIPFEDARVQVLCGLLPYLALARQSALVAEALAIARTVEEPERRLAALRLMLPHLPEEERLTVLKQILNLIGRIEDKSRQLSGAESVTEYLSPDVWPEVMALAKKTKDEEQGFDLLSRLAPALSDRERTRLLMTIVRRYKFYTRKDALRKLAAAWQATGFSGLESQPEAWGTTLQALSAQSRGILIGELTALAPLIVHLGRQAAVGDLFQAYRDVSNWWP